MKHTRRKTMKANFLARLMPAKLSTNRGSFDHTKSPHNRTAIRKGIRVCHRNCIPQKVMDYYGIPNWIEVDHWEIFHWSDYHVSVGGNGWKDRHIVDYRAKVRKIGRHRRLLRKDKKRYGLEHRLF